MFAIGELLAQGEAPDTALNEIFQATIRTEITLIMVTVDTGSCTLNVQHDESGAAFTNANRLIDKTVNAGDESVMFQAAGGPGTGIVLKQGAKLGLQAGTANVLRYSVYGVTANLAPSLTE